MLAALFKVFPFLWPFLKEMLLGGRNHPAFTNRKKAGWVKPVIGFLIVVLVSLGDAYLTSLKEIETLKAELASKKDVSVNTQAVALMLCERDLTQLKSDLKDFKSTTDAGMLSCTQAKQELAELLTKPPPSAALPINPVVPKSIKETQRQKVQRKLNELKANEK